MTDYFKNQGRSLLSNGYLIVPISPGQKFPAELKSWQKARLSMGDLQNYPNSGVGVLCGQGAHPVVGVDIDVSHPVIGPALIDWCNTHLGSTCERVGAAPRILLAYRAAAAGWTKGNSVMFFDPTDPVKPSGKPNHQQVEVLGLGQQFVAYHRHPDTGRDYQWVDMLGGLEHVRASELPVVTEAQIEALLVEVARLARSTPGVEMLSGSQSPGGRSGGGGDDDLMALSARTDTPIAEISELLSHLENRGDHYDVWLRVGAALHHEYAGTEHEDAALQLWRDYGAKSDKDKPSEYGYKWRSFGGQSGAPTTLRWLLKMCHLAKRENDFSERRASLEKAKALIQEQTDSLRLGGDAVVKQLKELIPDDPLVRQELMVVFQQQYKALTKVTMPITQVRSLLLGPRTATVHAKRPLTEFGNAERMLDRYGDGMMFVPELQTWYLWTGVYWRRAVEVEIEHLAKETVRALPNEVDEHEERAEFFQFCALSQQARMVKNMVHLAQSDPRVAVPARELDACSHLLGVRNGVVDLRTGELLPPDPDHRITLVTGCDYVPTAKCPLFEQTVLDAFKNDQEMTDYFMLSLGYALMGRPKEDILFIPFGNGSNGKSTILGTVRTAFGAYARSVEAASFVSDGKGGGTGGPREDLVRLQGARFVYVNEPDEGGELREGSVKSMTGGDAITARGMFAKHSIEIIPTFVAYMPTNHKPIIKGSDNGIWRRIGLIPFERDYDNEPGVVKDPDREEKLLLELPGVLSALVRAALRYQKGGLVAPAAVKAARDQYRNQSDLLAEWLEECCEVGPALIEESNRLWMSWEQFAKNRGILNYVKSSVALARRLEGRFPSVKGPRGVRQRAGICLKASFESLA